MNGNFRSKPRHWGEGAKMRLADKWLMSFLLCHRNTLPCHCSLMRHTKYDYTSIFLFFLSQLPGPAVKHAKANYVMKQTPETHALAGNFFTLERHFNSKTKTSVSLHICKKELQFLSYSHLKSLEEALIAATRPFS